MRLGLRFFVVLASIAALSTPAAAMSVASTGDDLVAAEIAVLEAERALQAGETQIAESRYRTALLEGWLLLGALEVAAEDLDAAATAYERAGTVAVETRRATLARAFVEIRRGEADAAVARLQRLLARSPEDLPVRRLFARALAAAGRTTEAVEELREAVARHPDDLELAFTLATGLLREEDVDGAAERFAALAEARPIAATHVLVGRTWRDFGHFDRARGSLEKALDVDPRARRAHYYLGTVALRHDGRAALEEAIEHFRAELEVAPGDPIASLFLGISLVETRQFEAALDPLATAAAVDEPLTDAFLFRGRALLGLGRPDEARQALEKAVEISRDDPTSTPDQLTSLHYQLASALRRLGREDEAAEHFDLARDASVELALTSRERLGRYLDDIEPETATDSGLTGAGDLRAPAVDELETADRSGLRARVVDALARSYLNLGVMQSQAGRPERAADLLGAGAEIAPDFPRLQYSLGVARFQAGRHAEALEPLEAALDGLPSDPLQNTAEAATIHRMLALSRLETGDPAGAAETLADPALRGDDPSLHYAWALALVRSGRPEAAEPVFARLLAEHDDWAELHVLLGQAHAQRSEYRDAIAAFEKALSIDSTVAEAHGSLGVIHLRRGDLEAAEAALRAEIALRPGDARSRYHLATVLDLARRQDEAIEVLRRLLADAPDHGDARYLLGKILLVRGDAEGAAVQLEAAARLSPETPEVRNQLGQAYQRLGETERARAEFAAFRELKAAERENE